MCCNQSEILLNIFNAQEGPEAKAKVKLPEGWEGGGLPHERVGRGFWSENLN